MRHPSGQPHLGQQLLGPGAGLGIVLAGDQQRHHHVLQRGELPEQVMELEDEPQLSIADCGQALGGFVAIRLAAQPDASRRTGVSSAPSRCSSVLFPEPLAPTMATNSPRLTVRSTPDNTSIGLPSPPR